MDGRPRLRACARAEGGQSGVPRRRGDRDRSSCAARSSSTSSPRTSTADQRGLAGHAQRGAREDAQAPTKSAVVLAATYAVPTSSSSSTSALLILVGAVGVDHASKNPVHAALSLIMTLFGVAVAFVAQSADFLAAVQIIVYAGRDRRPRSSLSSCSSASTATSTSTSSPWSASGLSRSAGVVITVGGLDRAHGARTG